jgi:hypothetical protein
MSILSVPKDNSLLTSIKYGGSMLSIALKYATILLQGTNILTEEGTPIKESLCKDGGLYPLNVRYSNCVQPSKA